MTFKFFLSLAFAILLAQIIQAQPKMKTYEKEWKHVDSLANNNGLTESALAEVNKIYKAARAEGNDAQLIKALLYRMGLQQLKEEEPTIKNIHQLEAEIATAKEPVRAILQSLAASEYLSWFQQHRWQLYNRTQTANFKKDDIATWSANDFHQRIADLFLASVSNEKLLQQNRVEAFDPIIIKGQSRNLRPTLFDLLAHRALDYFKGDERDITRPAYAFEVNDEAAFADATVFIQHSFKTSDSTSLHARALQLLQHLLAFHVYDAQPDAFIDVDIERITFVQSVGVMENKEALYMQALERLVKRHGYYPAATQASYLMALQHVNNAQLYKPLQGETNRYEYLQAKAICEKVIAQPDSSEGKANCQNLLQQIVRKEFSLQTEKVNVPGQPFRSLVTFRNVSGLHFRIVKMDPKLREQMAGNRYEESYWKNLLKLPVVTSFDQNLPDTKDHQQHTTEIKIDALPAGAYALIASIGNNFELTDNQLGLQFFYVSNIAYISKDNDYFILNRETGQPLSGAQVQVWYRAYDYSKRKYTDSKGQSGTADQHGYIKLTAKQANNGRESRLEITTANDHLLLDDYDYRYYSYPNNTPAVNEEHRTAFLFTDRAIYRPGQTLYFKGILVSYQTVSKITSVVPNFAGQVTLTDANGQPVDTIAVTTNEYGSYSGKITLPTGLLNGHFMLTDALTGNSVGFSVEEYKRPKFLVELPKPTGTYKLNETIQVTGNAKAYAGNAIDGAMVKYRVVRKVIMPMWEWGYRKMIWPPSQREAVEIAHGETTTNANGEFHISFTALPDKNMAKESQPTFYYEVSADVTDVAGETRSGNTQVAVAYQALKLNLDVPEKLHTDSLKSISLLSTNLNDIAEKTTATVSIYKLQTPNRIYRERLWEQPDTAVLSQEAYYRLFPYDVYKDENEPSKWARAEKVWEKTASTENSNAFTIDRSSFAAGWYAVEAVTNDKDGEPVKAIQYVQLYNQTVVNPIAGGSIETGTSTLEPGGKAQYNITTTLEDVFVIHELLKKDHQEERSLVALNKNSRAFEWPVTENERGGFGVQIAFIKHNRLYTDNHTFTVPYTNKELSITYATFRDKTVPGSEEKWKVKISGYKGEQVAAELLTAMYDASLDQFAPHSWSKPGLWDYFTMGEQWEGRSCFATVQSETENLQPTSYAYFPKSYDQLGIPGAGYIRIGAGRPRMEREMLKKSKESSADLMESAIAAPAAAPKAASALAFAADDRNAGKPNAYALDSAAPANAPAQQPGVQIRTNLNETAFFFPDLHTDANGAIEFSFTMPEAVTQWKWMTLAHTKDLAFGYNSTTIVTQKDLMVQPNAPRFLREGDRMDFSGKIVNLTDKEVTGQVQLLLIDPTTNQSVDGWFRNMFPNQYFTVGAKQSVPVSFTVEIPYQYNKPVTYRLVATANGNNGQAGASDGEEGMLPVVSNRMLVTESLPLPIRGTASKNFTFDKLLKSGNSETLSQHALTVEFTTNPAWYAVQALPYLMEYPYECAEQLFNRYYANTLATTIANASPKIKEIFERWKTADTSALLSNLQKNEELKSVLLQETPWVLQAKSEAQQKRNIALLFDLVRMSTQQQQAMTKLRDLQSSNGGFVWFKGGPDDRYITQYIATGIGHLKKLQALPASDQNLDAIIKQAIPYLDERIQEDYEQMLKHNKNVPIDNNLGYTQIQYLYMRSFFPEAGVPGSVFKAYDYYRKQSQKHWLQQSRYMQGMIALALFRTGDVRTAQQIVASLKQNALVNEEMGMYWKDFTGGYYWYQAPVESQALMIEVFSEVTKDAQAVNDMKTWLLKQKQTQDWKTTRATAEACYALLLQGTNWLTNAPEVTVELGNTAIRSKDQQQEAGTGYFKKVIDGSQVKPAMGNIKVSITPAGGGKEGAAPAWGAVYWQYFEDLDKITPAATPLQLTKKLFVEKNTDNGPVLQPVTEGDALKVGDKVKVRIELRVDRAMEYVHMKDMRAACLEPVNVISSYKWQGGLGYYETTKDASTNFFFGWLPKGTYVFEYPLFVTHTGTFSNGVTTIQCMYAPEFTSHSEGVKVKVE
jgi:uncharacterized protein YfaS (alpha-2-macroglobulin family)